MGIEILDDCEFTVLMAEFIKSLAGHDKFTVKIWISGSEIAYTYNHKSDFMFMQEGFSINTGEWIDYLYYDTIVAMRIYYES